MKFFLASTILAAIAGTSTAAVESTCCNALASNGCADSFPVQKSGSITTANGVQLVTCCASAEGQVDLTFNNPACAGSDIPAPAPTPTVIGNIEANTPVTFGGSTPGMPDAAASCEALESQFQDCTCSVQCQDGETECLEADSAGCGDAANTFCANQGSSVYLSCGHSHSSEMHSETHSETHSSTSTTTTTTTTTTTGSTEYVCNNGEYCTLSSNGGLCSPIGQGLPSGNTFMPSLSGEGASTTVPFTCIGINGRDLVSGGGSCQMSCPDTCKVTPDVTNPCGSMGSAPSPTPSAGFTSSTSVAIGASVAFLAMIFV